MSATSDPCPCGTGQTYAGCCRALHQQQRLAESAVELMRSRYSAYVLRVDDHVFRTWHPRTRPEDVTTSPSLRWEGLTVVETQNGGRDDDRGTVEFVARWSTGGERGAIHERSRFERRAGRWFYVDGDDLG